MLKKLGLFGALLGTLLFAGSVHADGLDSHTKLLIHANGTNGSQSFVDSSASNHTITTPIYSYYDQEANDACIDTATKKFGTGSAYIAQYSLNEETWLYHYNFLAVDDSDDFCYSTGDFTIDLQAYFTSADGYQVIYSQGGTFDEGMGWSFDPGNCFQIYTSGYKLEVAVASGGSYLAYYTTTNNVLTLNTWIHLAFVRHGSDFYIFVGGDSKALTVATAIGTNAIPNLSGPLLIGDNLSYQYSLSNGWYDEYRVSDCARWTANFTPPTEEYSAATTSSISKISGVAQASISKVSGVAIADIKKVSGVANQ